MSYVCSTVINQSGFKVWRGKKGNTLVSTTETIRCWRVGGVFPSRQFASCRTHFTFVLCIETVVVISGATRPSLYVSWYIFIDTLPLFTFHILPAALQLSLALLPNSPSSLPCSHHSSFSTTSCSHWFITVFFFPFFLFFLLNPVVCKYMQPGDDMHKADRRQSNRISTWL